jgi:hypothetical protein
VATPEPPPDPLGEWVDLLLSDEFVEAFLRQEQKEILDVLMVAMSRETHRPDSRDRREALRRCIGIALADVLFGPE